jgi:hypothetical protein
VIRESDGKVEEDKRMRSAEREQKRSQKSYTDSTGKKMEKINICII